MRSFLSQCPDVVVKIEDRDFYAKKLAPWDTLQNHVERLQFEDQKDVLDMISDVRSKLKRSEPVPNFLFTTLRDYLIATKLTPYFEAAIQSTQEK